MTHQPQPQPGTVNTRIVGALTMAANACHLLGLDGYCVLSVDAAASKPRIVIEPPVEPRWLRGAVRRRETLHGVTRTVVAAPYHGCQVEWIVVDTARDKGIVYDRSRHSEYRGRP